jgi:SAM-dependent methyltransferase
MGLGIKTAIIRWWKGREPITAPRPKTKGEASAEYWSQNNVTAHKIYGSVEESLAHLRWRNDVYYGYDDLMPVKGFDGKVVVDFGCGPGHDLVGFGVHSKPSRLIAIDVSVPSIAEAKDRTALHGIPVEFILQQPDQIEIPLPSASVDHVHSSGVLHHTPDPVPLLKELRRILKPGGTVNIMVYNWDSIFVHLYIAYVRMVLENAFPGEDIKSAFRQSTDGPGCPISNVYRPQEWVEICRAAGLEMDFTGAALSLFEMDYFTKYRFAAASYDKLSEESRKFLIGITLDDHGRALHNGKFAGVDACFSLVR